MLVQADAKALEIMMAAYLSKDPVLMQEILDGVDMHSINQEAFGLPSRLIAKILNFRIIYGGTEHSFVYDPDFTSVSTSLRYWKQKIDAFYTKYKGIAKWHEDIISTVTKTGELRGPTGRIWKFSRDIRGEWPVTQIKNYPVQGTGADIVAIARVSFAKRFKSRGLKGLLISTVHDSIVVDVENEDVFKTCQLFHEVFDDIPLNFERIFKIPFTLPTKCEVQYGPNLKDLTVYEPMI